MSFGYFVLWYVLSLYFVLVLVVVFVLGTVCSVFSVPDPSLSCVMTQNLFFLFSCCFGVN